jgi:hypothetical protein
MTGDGGLESNISHYMLFGLRDADSSKADLFQKFGIMRDDDAPKPAYATFRSLIQELGAEPRLAALSAAGDLGADPVPHQSGYLARPGMPPERRFGKEEVTVKGHLEATPRRGKHGDVRDHRRPAGEQFVRQTDGARDVVSGNAELDLEMMPGVQHGAPPDRLGRGYRQAWAVAAG